MRNSRSSRSPAGVNQLAWRGSTAIDRGKRSRRKEKKARARRASNSSFGGSWTSRQSAAVPSGSRSARKLSTSERVPASLASCVIVFGIFSAKRKPAGTLAAQRANVDARCGRWNVELISTHRKTRAYRSRCVPSPGNRRCASRGRLQPAVPISNVPGFGLNLGARRPYRFQAHGPAEHAPRPRCCLRLLRGCAFRWRQGSRQGPKSLRRGRTRRKASVNEDACHAARRVCGNPSRSLRRASQLSTRGIDGRSSLKWRNR